MPLTVTDLLEPNGPIQGAFFPADTQAALETRIGAYLTRALTGIGTVAGLTEVQQDEAVTAYVLWKSLEALVARLSAEAASVTIADQGGQTRTDTQLRALIQQRDENRAVWEAYVPTQSIVETAPTRARIGGAVSTRVRW